MLHCFLISHFLFLLTIDNPEGEPFLFMNIELARLKLIRNHENMKVGFILSEKNNLHKFLFQTEEAAPQNTDLLNKNHPTPLQVVHALP